MTIENTVSIEFSIVICRNKWQSKTLFLSIFDQRLSIVKSVFDCRLTGVSQIFLKYADNNPYHLYSNSDDLLFTHLLTK